MKNFGTIYRYEIKKLVNRKLVKVSLFCMLVIVLVTVAGSVMGSYSAGGITERNYDAMCKDREYRQALDGRLIDQALLEEVMEAYGKVPEVEKYSRTEEYQTYARPYSAVFQQVIRRMSGMTTAQVFAWEPEEQEFYERWNATMEQQWASSHLTEREKEVFREQKKRISLPLRFFSVDDSYYELFEGINTIGMMEVFLMLICLAGVFPEEHAKKTDQLLLGCRNGKQVLFRAKLLAGISFALVVSVVYAVLAMGVAFLLYGADGFDAPFYFIMESYLYPITFGEAILICYGLSVAAAVCSAVFVMALSEVIHSSLATLSLSVGVLFAGMFLSIPAEYRVLSQLWDYLPSRFMMVYKIFDYRMVPVGNHYLMAWQAVPFLYLLLCIVFSWIGKKVYLRYQVSGR